MTQSRPKRWIQAATDAREAFDRMIDIQGELHDALNELAEINSEYQDWYDNMPEGLQNGPTGDKLQELADFDFEIEVALDDYEEAIANAEGADLPVGFGRD